MPLPVWLIPLAIKGAAVAAGAAGVGSAVSGAKKMKEAKETLESANRCYERNMERFEEKNKITSDSVKRLGELELNILHSFGEFSYIFEQIKSKPIFEKYSKDTIEIPQYNGEVIKNASISADAILSGIGAGMISSLSSTAISSIALGGMAIGSGGVASSVVIGASANPISFLIGGAFFNSMGKKLSNQADEAWSQVRKAEKQIDQACVYLGKLRKVADRYYYTLLSVNKIYSEHLQKLKNIVIYSGNYNWKTFSEEEKMITENTVLLVGLLYSMCKVELILKTDSEDETNKINYSKVNPTLENARKVMKNEFECDI